MEDKIGNYFILDKKKRPSTPMRLVMGNSYGLNAETNILDEY